MNALILIDIQNDFLSGGSLEVPKGDEIIDNVNSIMDNYNIVVATKDWHPKDHISFASNHKNKNVGQIIKINNLDQMLWPDHCIKDSKGSEFPKKLDSHKIHKIFYKGVDSDIDSYSGFYDNGKIRSTGLSNFLKKSNINQVDIVGLATDYCVKYSSIDAYNEGFKTKVLCSCVRGISVQTTEIAFKEMKDMGISII
ncbi:MAG: bifunctional nicotinamidase/pyrazinamidase [Bacteroidota bacterium]|nr:bifunctional nicotinamidase/pyrazinamidase [Bacteroidota bacterium]